MTQEELFREANMRSLRYKWENQDKRTDYDPNDGKTSFDDDRHLYKNGPNGPKKESINWTLDPVSKIDQKCNFLPIGGRLLTGAIGQNIAKVFWEVTLKYPLTRISPFNLNHAHMMLTPQKEIVLLFHAQDDQIKQIRQNIIKQAQVPVLKKEQMYGLELPPPTYSVLSQILPNPYRPGLGPQQNIKSVTVPMEGISVEVDVSDQGCKTCSSPEDRAVYLAHRNIYWKNGKFKLIKGKAPYYTVSPEEFTEHSWIADVMFDGLQPPLILYRPVLGLEFADMA